MIYLSIAGAVVVLVTFLSIVALRVVVPTNAVHIVQSRGRTVSFGKDQTAGNSYYRWPAWMPVLGVSTIVLPMSVFTQELKSYSAYDKDRLPFHLDVTAFFRIVDSNMAAQRVSSIADLHEQLGSILMGAVRTILAMADIQTILEGRKEFGDKFTEEVDSELKEWGIQTVKSIALMDIRDEPGSTVIASIMAKQQSVIEMQSRSMVADNRRAASMAEIDADRAVKTQQQDAAEQVGIRTAEQAQKVGIANEKAKQAVAEQGAITAEKDMMVNQVQQVRAAEIERQVQVVAADQARQTAVISAEGTAAANIASAAGLASAAVKEAEGQKQTQILVADGTLATMTKLADGVRAEGLAKAAAEAALLMAPVTAQLALAEKIGQDAGYQSYLVEIRKIEAGERIGVEQATALTKASIKVIATAGDPGAGLTSAMDLFTPKGGATVSGMLEALASNDEGAALIKRFAERNAGGKK